MLKTPCLYLDRRVHYILLYYILYILLVSSAVLLFSSVDNSIFRKLDAHFSSKRNSVIKPYLCPVDTLKGQATASAGTAIN